ncbi:TetR/AcrR family transcriptional regulator [Nocardia seriolae]|nr:TetR/AcrR family transcriptional regulator [Nocardia seriolae]QOW33607.1 TetR/AcrR family transcriptional regulator [Nocardia seriolae]QUN20640.1 TetR/AcrR family transcriptional regulator [Nocardia seriolae]WKY53423.1 helix-turn-helix domain-containing protein [Nocardia seriolae]WNJ60160.1 helix-turn-helix domain-containing protein [Nocardia seriolae]BAW09928.1 transcriptional regulator [Nocardia seriolae]
MDPLDTEAGLSSTQQEYSDRHRAAREALLVSQRGRLLEGISECVEAKGYGATTLTDIVARARVSRSTFYEHFASKEECFVAAVEAGALLLYTRIAEETARLEHPDARALVLNSLTTYCDVVIAEPHLARLVLVEAVKAGGAAVARHDASLDLFTALYREYHLRALTEFDDVPPVSDGQLALIVDAIAERTRRLIERGEIALLPQHLPDLRTFALAVLRLPSDD